MRIIVTGSRGFMGKNLCARLREVNHEVIEICRDTSAKEVPSLLRQGDFVVHLAGVNRPLEEKEFEIGNRNFTEFLCKSLKETNPTPLIFASSVQAELDNAYGKSKRASEDLVESYGLECGVPTLSIRFPNVFGKWSRPRYNSAIATFCDSIINNQEYRVHNRDAPLRLIYIDDAVDYIIAAIEQMAGSRDVRTLSNIYHTTVGEVIDTLLEFKNAGETLTVGDVGVGLRRALYSTYISFLPQSQFSYKLPIYSDSRGAFVEMLRTPAAGQFSYFTAHPGVTRGGHYHHTKTEKFLVISGLAKFRFRNLLSHEKYEIEVYGGSATVVETIPGWVHDITNIGQETLVVMLWANEKFDRAKPDTFAAEL